MKILFMRHGESETNVMKIKSGAHDVPLTEKGVMQAKQAASELSNLTISHIISSKLSRSKNTADIVAQELGLETESWDDLAEINIGEFSNTEISKSFNSIELAARSIKGETLAGIIDRAERVIEKLRSLPPDSTVLVVGHHSFITAIFAFLDGIRPDDLIAYRKNWKKLKNCEVKILDLSSV